MNTISKLLKLSGSPFIVCSFIFGISFFALAAAFASEAFLGLEPCILCIYQRYPYAAAMLFSVFGLVFHKKPKAVNFILILNSITFLINSLIAFYHSGVERHWWKSFSESCSVFDVDTKKQSVLENILSTPMGHCDEIPWKDPIIGFSMANYNVIVCLLLSGFCAYAARRIFKKSPEPTSQPSQP